MRHGPKREEASTYGDEEADAGAVLFFCVEKLADELGPRLLHWVAKRLHRGRLLGRPTHGKYRYRGPFTTPALAPPEVAGDK